MNLYAVLIGINKYPTQPLSKCVHDMELVHKYLKRLKKTHFTEIDIKTLKDSRASKAGIVSAIREQFAKAGDDDVAVLYFSGHGAQEQTAGYFPEEHDGLLESMVCYARGPISTSQFLSNKELRYLMQEVPNKPHLVTIFDACHSGDIVRAFRPEEQQGEDMIKRVAGTFPARKFNNFLFSEDQTIRRPNADGFSIYIPYKNHVHIAACLSSELSWENSKGGVFTRYLMDLLEATAGDLSYLDITRWSKISMQGVTQKKQTPTISIQGEGKLNAESPWLNLYPNRDALPQGKAIKTNDGWIYTRGSLLGVQKGMPVLISLDDDEIIATVKEADVSQSTLSIPVSEASKMDFRKTSYPARTEQNTYSTLRVAVNDIDHDAVIAAQIRDMLREHPNVELSASGNADFVVNLFNGFAYFTLPDHDFEPLAQQIRLDTGEGLKPALTVQLKSLIKWNHFFTLENPGKDYKTCPLEVAVEQEDGSWKTITNDTYRMSPRTERLNNGLQFQRARIRVKNTGREKLYIGVLTLGSDIGISSKPFQGKTIELDPGASKTFYDHQQDSTARLSLDSYKEVYNWKEEWFYYKLIFYNHNDFSDALNDGDYLQPELPAPLTINRDRTMREFAPKGEGGEELEEVRKKWGTCFVRMELANADYNIVSGDLLELWDEYAKSEDLAPFILERYTREDQRGLSFKPVFKTNDSASKAAAARATDRKIVQLLNTLYNISRRRRFRRQRKKGGPIIVAEGDSWFLYPKPGVRDTLDYIMDHYSVQSLARAGDEIKDYVKKNDLLKAVIDENPDYVLISGGGNDILGSEIKAMLQRNVRDGKKATDFLKTDVFEERLKFLGDSYEMFFTKITALKPGVKIFIHGYDYVRSDPDASTIKHGWANKYMIGAGMKNADDRKLVIAYLVDTFNDMLEGYTRRYPNVYYVNHRGTIALDEWMDEIHPNNVGYGKVADNFLRKIASA